MIIKVTMTRKEMTSLRLDNHLSKTLVVKLLRAGVVLEASVTDVDVDYAPHTPTYRIVGNPGTAYDNGELGKRAKD